MSARDNAGLSGALGALCMYAIGYPKYLTMVYTLIRALLVEPISKPGP